VDLPVAVDAHADEEDDELPLDVGRVAAADHLGHGIPSG
jgi:hypothetical protein